VKSIQTIVVWVQLARARSQGGRGHYSLSQGEIIPTSTLLPCSFVCWLSRRTIESTFGKNQCWPGVLDDAITALLKSNGSIWFLNLIEEREVG